MRIVMAGQAFGPSLVLFADSKVPERRKINFQECHAPLLIREPVSVP